MGVIALFAAVMFARAELRSWEQLAALQQVANFVQVLKVTAYANVAWPGVYDEIMAMVKVLSFDLETASPECYAGAYNWHVRYAGNVCAYAVPAALISLWIRKLGKDNKSSFSTKLRRLLIIVFSFGYETITRVALRSWQFVKNRNTGEYLLLHDPTIPYASAEHIAVLFVSLLLLVFVSYGFPIWLYRFTMRLRRDNRIRDADVRFAYGSLYDCFKDKYCWFQVAVVLRKGFEIAVFVLARPLVGADDPTYNMYLRATMIAGTITLVLVSMGYMWLVMKVRPFVPHEHKFTVCGKVLRLDLFNDLEIYGNGLLIVNKLGALIMAFVMPSAVITNDEEGDTDVESGGDPHPAGLKVFGGALAVCNVIFSLMLLVNVGWCAYYLKKERATAAQRNSTLPRAKSAKKPKGLKRTTTGHIGELQQIKEEVEAAVARRSFRAAERHVRQYQDTVGEARHDARGRRKSHDRIVQEIHSKFVMHADQSVAAEEEAKKEVAALLEKFGHGDCSCTFAVEKLCEIADRAAQRALFVAARLAHEEVRKLLKVEVEKEFKKNNKMIAHATKSGKSATFIKERVSAYFKKMRDIELAASKAGDKESAKEAYAHVARWCKRAKFDPPKKHALDGGNVLKRTKSFAAAAAGGGGGKKGGGGRKRSTQVLAGANAEAANLKKKARAFLKKRKKEAISLETCVDALHAIQTDAEEKELQLADGQFLSKWTRDKIFKLLRSAIKERETAGKSIVMMVRTGIWKRKAKEFKAEKVTPVVERMQEVEKMANTTGIPSLRDKAYGIVKDWTSSCGLHVPAPAGQAKKRLKNVAKKAARRGLVRALSSAAILMVGQNEEKKRKQNAAAGKVAALLMSGNKKGKSKDMDDLDDYLVSNASLVSDATTASAPAEEGKRFRKRRGSVQVRRRKGRKRRKSVDGGKRGTLKKDATRRGSTGNAIADEAAQSQSGKDGSKVRLKQRRGTIAVDDGAASSARAERRKQMLRVLSSRGLNRDAKAEQQQLSDAKGPAKKTTKEKKKKRSDRKKKKKEEKKKKRRERRKSVDHGDAGWRKRARKRRASVDLAAIDSATSDGTTGTGRSRQSASSPGANSALNVFGMSGPKRGVFSSANLTRKQSNARLVAMMRAREEHNRKEAAKLEGIDE